MLIQFKVKNYRSIGEELIFSMIATADNSLPQNFIDVPKYSIKLLKTMAIFGGNAAGKSNILTAIATASDIVTLNRDDKNKNWLNDFFDYNKNNPDNAKKPIEFSFDLLLDGVAYCYAFAYLANKITYEKLVKYPDNEVEEVIYERKQLEGIKYSFEPISFFEDESNAYFRKGTAQNVLFLSMANNPVNEELIKVSEDLKLVYNWFEKSIFSGLSGRAPGKINPDDLITFLNAGKRNKKLLLKCLDLIGLDNIKDIEVLVLSKHERKIRQTRTGAYSYTNEEGEEIEVGIKTYHAPQNSEKGVKLSKKDLIPFDLFLEESHGTEQFLSWIGTWLNNMRNENVSKTFFADEFGNSLHPLLTRLMVKFFYSEKTNKNQSQFIFTTHEVKLMENNLMRLDQILLVDKKDDGNSVVKRCSDYTEISSRKDQYARFDNLYMNGGTRGLPYIPDFIDFDDIF